MRYGNSAKACPFNRGNRAIAPRHSPLVKSKPTTSSRATQYRTPLGRKAQAARFAELSLFIGRENSDEVSVPRIVFPNARHRIHRAEWMLAGDDDIAVGRDCEIERTQFGIRDQPRGLHRCAWSKGHYGVIALPVRADS